MQSFKVFYKSVLSVFAITLLTVLIGGKQVAAVVPPTVSSPSATGISATSESLRATETADGGSAPFLWGFDYGLTSAYGSSVSQSTAITVGTPFLQTVNGLSCGTLYHYRGFATNSAGKGTTADATFTTSACPPPPTFSYSGPPSGITQTSATLGAQVSSAGTGSCCIVSHGFQYGPTVAYGSYQTTATLLLAGGTFTETVINLVCGTTYHYRAMGTNNNSVVGYGSDQTFSTAACPVVVVPTLTFNSATNVTQTSATLSGNLTNLGGGTVTNEGFEYAFDSNFTNGDTKIWNVPSTYNTGPYVQNASTGLSCGNTYYVRAIAVNSAGTGASTPPSTFNTFACPDLTPPTAPTPLNLVATPTYKQVALSWNPYTDPSGILRYNIYRNGSALGTSAVNSYTDSDPALTSGTSYTYTISATDASGNANTTAQSAGVSAKIPYPNATMTGFGWSNNIGWISFNSSNSGAADCGQNLSATPPIYPYCVQIDGTTGNLSGYAWSSNLGWLSFNFSDASGCPGATQANFNQTTRAITGWAIFLNGKGRTDGWDGCVKLSDTTSGVQYPTSVDTTTGKFAGNAWGNMNTGWMRFNYELSADGSTENLALVGGGGNAPPACNPPTCGSSGSAGLDGVCSTSDNTNDVPNPSTIHYSVTSTKAGSLYAWDGGAAGAATTYSKVYSASGPGPNVIISNGSESITKSCPSVTVANTFSLLIGKDSSSVSASPLTIVQGNNFTMSWTNPYANSSLYSCTEEGPTLVSGSAGPAYDSSWNWSGWGDQSSSGSNTYKTTPVSLGSAKIAEYQFRLSCHPDPIRNPKGVTQYSNNGSQTYLYIKSSSGHEI